MAVIPPPSSGDPLSTFRNLLHNLLPFVGLLATSWAVIAQFLDQLGVSGKIVSGIGGAIGLLAVLASKYIDSQSYTAIQVAQAPLAVTPPAVVPGP